MKKDINWNNGKICDMTTNGKYIYILSYTNIFKYDINGMYITDQNINESYNKIIVDKDKIYVSEYRYRFIDIYSNDQILIKKSRLWL